MAKFAEGMESVKNNVEGERLRYSEVEKQLESMFNELKLREEENGRLLQFSTLSKQTIDELEKKSEMQNDIIDKYQQELENQGKLASELEDECQKRDQTISQLRSDNEEVMNQMEEFTRDMGMVQAIKQDLDA